MRPARHLGASRKQWSIVRQGLIQRCALHEFTLLEAESFNSISLSCYLSLWCVLSGLLNENGFGMRAWKMVFFAPLLHLKLGRGVKVDSCLSYSFGGGGGVYGCKPFGS